jgi:hypothetical protein|nr:MAG TPA: hypothetical protein [Caudoviricetes sp.]
MEAKEEQKVYAVYDPLLYGEIPFGKETYILVKTEYDEKRGFVIETFKTNFEDCFWLRISKKIIM